MHEITYWGGGGASGIYYEAIEGEAFKLSNDKLMYV